MIAGLTFAYGVLAVFLTVNTLRKPPSGTSRFPPLWLPAMITGELAEATVILRLAIAGVTGLLGAADNPIGRTGLGLIGLSLAGMVPVFSARKQAVNQLGSTPGERLGWKTSIFGRHRLPTDVIITHQVPFSDGLTLDLYEGRGFEHSPILVYVHGGSWTGGAPHRQGRAMFHRLAAHGWMVATIRYPLSPAATFPDHLIGVKRAIAWARHQSDMVVVAGGSAGGHLAALAALTSGEARYQPGFEAKDTSVDACIPIYGIFDFFNRNQTRWNWPVIPQTVMKATPEQEPALYRDASPLDQVRPDGPRFLVVHGANDSLVPPSEARHFVNALESVGAPVEYVEVIGAQHAFDAFNSPRARAIARRIEHFLVDLSKPG